MRWSIGRSSLFAFHLVLRESAERSRELYAIIRATQIQVHEHRRRRNCDRTESEFIDIRMEWESLQKSLFRRTNRLTLVLYVWDTLCVVLAALLSLPTTTYIDVIMHLLLTKRNFNSSPDRFVRSQEVVGEGGEVALWKQWPPSAVAIARRPGQSSVARLDLVHAG